MDGALSIGGPINRSINRLRGSLLGSSRYQLPDGHSKLHLAGDPHLFTPELEEWRSPIVGSNIADIIPLPGWIPVVNHLSSSLIESPGVLDL